MKSFSALTKHALQNHQNCFVNLWPFRVGYFRLVLTFNYIGWTVLRYHMLILIIPWYRAYIFLVDIHNLIKWCHLIIVSTVHYASIWHKGLKSIQLTFPVLSVTQEWSWCKQRGREFTSSHATWLVDRNLHVHNVPTYWPVTVPTGSLINW
jgi:hypothetical protein